MSTRKRIISLGLLAILAFSSTAGEEKKEKPKEIEAPGGIIRIGLQKNYIPFHIDNSKPGYPGIDVELATLLADFLGKKPVFRYHNIKTLISEVQSNKLNLAFGGISSNLRRAKQVLFSNPYIVEQHAALLDRKRLPPEPDNNTFPGKEFKTIEDLSSLSGLSIGVMKGTINEKILRTSNEFKDHDIKSYTDRSQLILDIKNRNISVLAGDNTFVRTVLLKNKDILNSFVYLTSSRRLEHLSVAISPDDTRLLLKVNFFIKELRRTGKLAAIKARYLENDDWIP